MMIRGIRLYGADVLHFGLEDGMVHIWLNDQAPEGAKREHPGGEPWTLRTVLLHGTDAELKQD